MHRLMRTGSMALWLLLASGALCAADGQGPSGGEAPANDHQTILSQIEWDPAAAMEAAGAWLDRVAAQDAAVAAEEELVEAAFTYRLARQMRAVPPQVRQEVMPLLLGHEDLARSLVFQIEPEDDPECVYDLLNRLRAARGEDVVTYATLAAAICVVHDEPLHRVVNENVVTAEDALVIFDYFSKGERRMNFGVRQVPAELLVYVVDVAASVEEMRWALKHYHGDDEVGRRFFDIQYDYSHFLYGREKRVTEAGFNLPNIKKYGGVCADQAYFASTIGKAIGVPAVYTRARGAQVSHAWVGFLQVERGKPHWNFDVGRYSAYRGVPGQVRCPQTGKVINDGLVSLSAVLIGTSAKDRFFAAACAQAARRLMHKGVDEDRLEPGEDPPVVDDVDADRVLALLERGLRRSPGDRRSWACVADLAGAGALSIAHKQRWADVVLRLCGDQYPDFAFDLLAPMIETVGDLRTQQALWERLGERMPAERLDLAARCRMAEGRMWERAGNRPQAGKCYLAVIERYINDGPYVLEALEQCERLLAEAKNPAGVLRIYDSAWERVDRPRDIAAEFKRQSNWAKIGQRYVQALVSAGQAPQAMQVQRRLDRELQDR